MRVPLKVKGREKLNNPNRRVQHHAMREGAEKGISPKDMHDFGT